MLGLRRTTRRDAATATTSVSPTANTTESPRVRRQRRSQLPEALPGNYVSPFASPVPGVAIIGCQWQRTEEELEAESQLLRDMDYVLEVVTPRHGEGPLSSSASTALDWTASERSSQPRLPDESLNVEMNDTNTVFRSSGRGSVSRQGSVSSTTSVPWNVLSHNYIMVTDEFAASHPHLGLSRVVSSYRTGFPETDAELAVDSARSPYRQRQMEASHYVALAEEEQRPLFRRRSSQVVYGSASYTDNAA